MANHKIPRASPIHITAQKMAGIPVNRDMFTASVIWGAALKGTDKKNTVLRSKRAFKTHCTARKLTKNEATFRLANRATRKRPTVKNKPPKRVK